MKSINNYTYLYNKKNSQYQLFYLTWRRPTFPGSLPPSIISAKELNFRVRDGYGCVLFAIVTKYLRFFRTLKTT